MSAGRESPISWREIFQKFNAGTCVWPHYSDAQMPAQESDSTVLAPSSCSASAKFRRRSLAKTYVNRETRGTAKEGGAQHLSASFSR